LPAHGTDDPVGSDGSPLTWSVGSIRTWEELGEGKVGNGQWRAAAPLRVTCRDLARLGDLTETLAAVNDVSFDGVAWLVDHDNAGWPLVRADAIAAALAKGGDFAAALGGTVRRVEHVADQGLLSHGDHAGLPDGVSLAFRAGAGGGHQPVPRLDPAPQELRAVIEARLGAEVPELGSGG
jgi:hypothetical protein